MGKLDSVRAAAPEDRVQAKKVYPIVHHQPADANGSPTAPLQHLQAFHRSLQAPEIPIANRQYSPLRSQAQAQSFMVDSPSRSIILPSPSAISNTLASPSRSDILSPLRTSQLSPGKGELTPPRATTEMLQQPTQRGGLSPLRATLAPIRSAQDQVIDGRIGNSPIRATLSSIRSSHELTPESLRGVLPVRATLSSIRSSQEQPADSCAAVPVQITLNSIRSGNEQLGDPAVRTEA